MINIHNSYTISPDIKLNLTQVKWSEVRDEIYKCNPQLAKICDDINKYGDYPLFKMHYPYGASIIKKGEFCLPTTNDQTISVKDERIPDFLQTSLTYSHIPLSLITNNHSEVFLEIENRIMPLNLLGKGELFGLFEFMNTFLDAKSLDTPIWSISSGARSTFMIPSISDMVGHNKIKKKLGVDIHVPSNLVNHWQTFVEINKHSDVQNSWQNTIVVFSDQWFKAKNNPSYIELYKYLVSKCWQQFQLLEDFTEFSLLWSFFAHAINKRNLKPRAYLIDTIKHLILIAKGSGVAFKPSIDDTALPMSLIQQMYVNEYNLKDYIPNIMQPARFSKDTQVYYSLSFPTLLDGSPYSHNPPSRIEDQREIKKLLDILMHTINKIENPSMNLLKNIKFTLFHSNQDPFGQIMSSKNIPDNDTRFLEYVSNSQENRVFCASSSFFNGCISISIKDEHYE